MLCDTSQVCQPEPAGSLLGRCGTVGTVVVAVRNVIINNQIQAQVSINTL